MKRDLCDLQAELMGASMILAGLSNQLDNKTSDSLMEEALQNAIFGVRSLIERVVDDLEVLEEYQAKQAHEECKKEGIYE